MFGLGIHSTKGYKMDATSNGLSCAIAQLAGYLGVDRLYLYDAPPEVVAHDQTHEV
jgi:hypothetical protein